MVKDESVKVEEQKTENQNRGAAEEQAAPKKDEEVGFSALYEQSLQELRSGEIVIGKVVQVSNDFVMVDVGSKTEGMIPARELRDSSGNIPVNVGDEIEVLVERRDEDDNLSRQGFQDQDVGEHQGEIRE
jgi:small subunit ribosomal protein S1